MKKIKLALVGCSGRMGQQIIKEIENFKNIDLVAAIEKNNSSFLNKRIEKLEITNDKKVAFKKADLIIDFSLPLSTLETLKYAQMLKKKLVIGTTGFNNSQVKKIKTASKKISIVFAPNMSIGINLLIEIVKKTSNILFSDNTSVEILDIHHKHKKDAPSGTAIALGKAVADGKNFNLKNKSTLKPNKKRKKQNGKVNFYCKRQGNVVGDHSVIFTNKEEEIELKHRGFNRSIYAIGAIKSTIWLNNKKKGFFYMSDILGTS